MGEKANICNFSSIALWVHVCMVIKVVILACFLGLKFYHNYSIIYIINTNERIAFLVLKIVKHNRHETFLSIGFSLSMKVKQKINVPRKSQFFKKVQFSKKFYSKIIKKDLVLQEKKC